MPLVELTPLERRALDNFERLVVFCTEWVRIHGEPDTPGWRAHGRALPGIAALGIAIRSWVLGERFALLGGSRGLEILHVLGWTRKVLSGAEAAAPAEAQPAIAAFRAETEAIWNLLRATGRPGPTAAGPHPGVLH